MEVIPQEYQIHTLVNQDTYLVNGELKNGQEKQLPYIQLFPLLQTMRQLY